MLQIFLDEETRIGKARLDHLFITIGHHIQPATVPVAHCDEIRQQFAIGIEHREVTLMFFHHRDQHIRREFKV